MSSMLSNLSFKLKGVLSKTGTSVKVTNDLERDLVISAINASVVLKNASGSVLERMQCSFSGGTMTIVQRGLDQSETKTSDTSIQYERRVGTIGYITVLASDLLDVDNSGYGANVMPNINFYGANNHYGEEIFKDVKVQLKFRIPTFATEAARDLVYTAPVDGDKCSVGGYEQNYNGATAQWEYLGVSTPLPNASTTAAGKVKIATQTEFNDGTDEASGLYNMPTISQVKDGIDQVLIDQTGTLDDQYMLGEPVIAGQCVFVESGPTTGVATTKQNICDVTGNTRVSFPVIGTGVASDTFKVNIGKTGTGHNSDQGLYFRIEIDNAGSPSGTLIDPNAIAHILPADLTTSLVDTTMTLAGSITIPLGQKCHIVARQSDSDSYGDVIVNGTNYYNIGYSTNNTSTRGLLKYNGTIRGNSVGADVNDANGFSYGFSGASTVEYQGYKIQSKSILYIKAINKNASSGATIATIKSLTGNILATANFVGNTATLSTPLLLVPFETIYVLVGNGGSSYTMQYAGGGQTYPVSGTNIDYLSGYRLASEDTNAYDISTITTYTSAYVGFPYISSTLFQDKLLSLTDATYDYKVDMRGISTESKGIGTYPKLTIQGINNNQSGLILGKGYCLSTIPGAITNTSTVYNSPFVGLSITSNKIKIGMLNYLISDKANISVYNGTSTSSDKFEKGGMVYGYVTCGGDGYIEMSSDGTNWGTLVHLVGPTCASGGGADSFSIPIPAGKYIRVRVSGTNGYGSYATIATVVMFDVQ